MKYRYSEFKDQIDVDAFEEAIGFEVMRTQGANDIGYCLFPDNHKHGDTTGKFALHRDKKVYNCFRCGGGSFLSLVMELFDYGVEEATDYLRKFTTSSSRSDLEFQQYLLDMLKDAEVRQATMPYFNERVLDRFKGPTDYFHSRGISQAVIERHKLCYSDTVMKPAPSKERNGERVKIDEDYLGPAAIFPHYWKGKLVGWQHRWTDHPHTPKWLPKYTNTTDFPKSDTLYNYDRAKLSPNPVCVVESIPTVLFLESYGYSAVAFFGDKPKPEQLRLLRAFGQGVILCPDNDEVGTGMAASSTQYLKSFVPVFHAEKVDMGPGADLADYAKMAHPHHAIKYHMDHKVHPAFSM